MYLARKRVRGVMHYAIRQSIREEGKMVSRELFELGSDPTVYVIYPDGGVGFYFHPRLVESLEAQGADPDSGRLERVFWPFLRPETRRAIETFARRSPGRGGPLHEQAKRCDRETFHLFDMRRIHFLRFGAMDQSGIGRVPKKIYRPLLDKSRDEIEQQFMEMEQVLGRTEKKNYVFTIFDVASGFRSEIARKFPQALDQEKVDAVFEEALCRLNADAAFWADLGVSGRLNAYLLRYAFWFFDTEFEGSAYLEDLMWQFKRRHHGFSPPPRQVMPVDEAVAVMGITRGELDGMTVRTLTRQYRIRAQTVHPDKEGGSHEQFIRLNRAFTDLLRRIKGEGDRVRYTTRRG